MTDIEIYIDLSGKEVYKFKYNNHEFIKELIVERNYNLIILSLKDSEDILYRNFILEEDSDDTNVELKYSEYYLGKYIFIKNIFNKIIQNASNNNLVFEKTVDSDGIFLKIEYSDNISKVVYTVSCETVYEMDSYRITPMYRNLIRIYGHYTELKNCEDCCYVDNIFKKCSKFNNRHLSFRRIEKKNIVYII